mgnify:CR=1 FL=1
MGVYAARGYNYSVQLLCAVTGDEAFTYGTQLRNFAAAALRCIGAARMKAAAGRGGDGAWQFTGQKRLLLKACIRVSFGNGVDEKARVRMQRRGIHICRAPDLA